MLSSRLRKAGEPWGRETDLPAAGRCCELVAVVARRDRAGDDRHPGPGTGMARQILDRQARGHCQQGSRFSRLSFLVPSGFVSIYGVAEHPLLGHCLMTLMVAS